MSFSSLLRQLQSTPSSHSNGNSSSNGGGNGGGNARGIASRLSYQHPLYSPLCEIYNVARRTSDKLVDSEGPRDRVRDDSTESKAGICDIDRDSAVSEPSMDHPPKIAVLLIIIDDLPHEAIWRLWSERQTNCRFFIHAKFPNKIRSAWVRQHLVRTFQYFPKWASIEIVKVMTSILDEALNSDPFITHFIYASESCIPITSFDAATKALQNSDGSTAQSSWINYYNIPTNGYAKDSQFDALKGCVPQECIYKSDQWVCLSRKHGQALTRLVNNFSQRGQPSIWSVFGKVRAADEMFIPTCMAIMGYITDLIEPDATSGGGVFRHRSTFVDWSENEPSPKTFSTLSPELMTEIKRMGTVFCRKFKLAIPLEDREDVIIAARLDLASKWLNLVIRSVDNSIAHSSSIDTIEGISGSASTDRSVPEPRKDFENALRYVRESVGISELISGPDVIDSQFVAGRKRKATSEPDES